MKQRLMTQAGICLALFVVFTVVAIFSSKVQWGFFGYVALLISGSLFTTIGVALGDAFRRFVMPDIYFTSGAIDSFKKKIFWRVGPQAIGWFLGIMATNGFMQNYLGYDMKTGSGHRQTTTDIEMEQMKAEIGRPVDIAAMQKAPENQVRQPAAEQLAPQTQSVPVVDVGACVMGVNRQTASGLEFVRPIPIYKQGDSVESIGILQEFSTFFVEEQHGATGRVRLVYAPGAFDDEPRKGQSLGWVNAADIEVYALRNCR